MEGLAEIRVAGIHVPAFVERREDDGSVVHFPRVAGIHVPAFVERRAARWPLAAGPSRVSPGFTSRPSLSDDRLEYLRRLHARVAGIHVPAFVERRYRARSACG